MPLLGSCSTKKGEQKRRFRLVAMVLVCGGPGEVDEIDGRDTFRDDVLVAPVDGLV